MKIITLDLTRFPPPVGVHPARWWWHPDGNEYREGAEYVRSDGMRVRGPQWPRDRYSRSGAPAFRLDEEREKEWRKDVADFEQALAEADCEHPLPAPPPRVGQVWVDEDGTERLVTSVAKGERDGYEHWGIRIGDALLTVTRRPSEPWPGHEWPPMGAVLISGPFSPWAPVEER